MTAADKLYRITSDRWARDAVAATIDEVRYQAECYARQTNGDDHPAEITSDERHIYADGERIGNAVGVILVSTGGESFQVVIDGEMRGDFESDEEMDNDEIADAVREEYDLADDYPVEVR